MEHYSIKCESCGKIICSKYSHRISCTFSKHLKVCSNQTAEHYYLKYIGVETNCKICNKKTKFINIFKGYQMHCSTKCAAANKETKEKQKETCNKLYGGIGYASIELANKSNAVTIERYGGLGYTSHIIKAKCETTMLEKYGVKHNFNGTYGERKCDLTINEKYGNDYQQLRTNKYKETCLERYGVDNYFKATEFQQLAKDTRRTKYQDENYNNREKAQDTCLIKYGVSNPAVLYGNFTDSFRVQTYRLENGQIIHYQSKPELAFILDCIGCGIQILDGDVIPYMLNNKKTYYHVDFKIKLADKWKLIEIKGRGPWHIEAVNSGVFSAKVTAAEEYSFNNDYLSYEVIYV